MTALRVLDELWQKFRAAPHTLGETPGVREAWHRGRAVFSVWLVRLDDARVTARVHATRTALAPWITPQPVEDLHVTSWVAGFPTHSPEHDDDVPWRVLEAQREAVTKLARQGSLQVGGLCSFLSVPFLSVHDDGVLAELRTALDAHGRELRFEPYVPHVTIGKYHGDHATADIARAIEPFAALAPIEVRITSVELAEVHAFADAPLTTRWRVPLG